MKYVFFLFLLMTSFSCTRGYYNTTPNEYNYKEAYDLVHGLKDGILIVQIPCDKRVLEVRKSLYENEKDAEKKELLRQELNAYKIHLTMIQEIFINGTQNYYDYSKYAFVPDTLIHEFKAGERNNVFLNSDFTFKNDLLIDTNKTIMILRDFRDYDNLFVHKIDGSYPPEPFPYASTVPTGNIGSINFKEMSTLKDKTGIHRAIYIISQRLKDFYNHRKPPN